MPVERVTDPDENHQAEEHLHDLPCPRAEKILLMPVAWRDLVPLEAERTWRDAKAHLAVAGEGGRCRGRDEDRARRPR